VNLANGPSTPPPGPAPPTPRAGAADAESAASRFADRLNPVLLRELRQGIRSRSFLVGLALVLAAIALVAVLIAASAEDMSAGEPFLAALSTLVGASIFIIPARALFAIGREVEPGMSEQILLSKLSPGQIVNGHLYAAAFHAVVFISLFAPLLALTYLLRGVDVLQVAIGLGAAAMLSLATSAAGVAIGSLGRWRAALPAVRALGAAGLTFAAGGGIVFISEALPELMRVRTFDPQVFRSMLLLSVLILALVVSLGRLVATAMLSHPFENRSTAFRVHGLVTTVLCMGWVAWALPSTVLDEAAPATAFVLCFFLAPLWVIAATEEEQLSPRVRLFVPKRSLLALLAAPLFPGGGRGLLFALGSAGLLVALLLGIPSWLTPGGVDASDASFTAMAVLYLLFYAATGRVIRSRLGSGERRSWFARAAVLIVFALGCVAPLILDAVIGGGVHRWHPGHILNPFWTIDAHSRHLAEPMLMLGGLTACMFLLATPAILRGLREMRRASAREATGAA
jgi:hypothetical protein